MLILLFDTVIEFDAGDEFWQLIFASQPQPGLLRLLDNLEDHQLHGLHGQTAFRALGSVTHRRKGSFNGVCRPDVGPVFRREVIKGEQFVLVPDQPFRRFRVFHLVFLQEHR